VRGRCPDCGLDLDAIGPGDAVTAVRSFPRRWRGAFALAGDAEDAVDLLRRRSADGWSAVEHAGWVATALGAYDAAVRSAVVAERPTVEVPSPHPVEADPETAVDGLAAAAESLAATLDRVDADAWTRPAVAGGDEVDVLWLARNAVHEGSHHLRATERTLREVRGR
jgi:hypothetical protein